MKKYKAKLKYDFAEALLQIIDEAITKIYVGTDDDRLFVAGLAEAKLTITKKMVTYRPAYVTTFSPVQAIALRLLYTEFVGDLCNQYTANRLRQIADEIHKHYS